MTELEKMQQGLLYDANYDQELLQARTRCKDLCIALNCIFSTAGHPLDTEQRNQGLEYAYPITVGDNVWFGALVTVLPGVTIGSNTVIEPVVWSTGIFLPELPPQAALAGY